MRQFYTKNRPLILLAALYTVSRLILYNIFSFRIDFLPWLMQLLDHELLRSDLLRSVFYNHSTPPLFNIFAGLILKIFPEQWWSFGFSASYFLFGLITTCSTYLILKHLKVHSSVSFVGALAVALFPITIRFERVLFYAAPLATLITVSVLFLIKFIETSTKKWLILFLGIITTIILTRNFFHVIFYLVPIFAGLGFFIWKFRQSLFKFYLVASMGLFALALLPNIHNYSLFGTFTSSTWQGLQLYSMTDYVPKEKIEELIREGKVTPLARISRWSNPEPYYEYFGITPDTDTHPAIDALYKSSGYINFNNKIYAIASKEYQRNALTVLKYYPEYYPERFLNSVYIFFSFSSYRFFYAPQDWLIIAGDFWHKSYAVAKLFVLPGTFAVLFFGILFWLVHKTLPNLFWKTAPPTQTLIWSFILFNLVYVFLVANVVEIGENNTARVPIDPLIIIMSTYLGWLFWKERNISNPTHQ